MRCFQAVPIMAAAWNRVSLSREFFGQFSDLRQMALEAAFQRNIAVNRHGDPERIARFTVDVVAAGHSKQAPSMAFQDFAKLFPREGLHTATSTIRLAL